MTGNDLEFKVGADTKQFEQSLAKMQKSLAGVGAISKRSFAPLRKEFRSLGNSFNHSFQESVSLKTGFKNLGTAAGTIINPVTLATAGIVGMGVAVTKGVTLFAAFEKELIRLRALSGISEQAFRPIKEGIEELNSEFSQFNSIEITQSLTDLVKSGVTASDGLTILETSMKASVVTGQGLIAVNGQIVDALNQFQLATNQSSRVANVFSQQAQNAKLETFDLSESLRIVGSDANSIGLSLEETAAAIGVIAENGRRGSDAGTQLRIVLNNLYRPTGAAADVIKSLGVETSNTDGTLKSLEEVLAQVKDATAGMTEAQRDATLAEIGGARATGTLIGLLNKADTSLKDFTISNNNANGVLDEQYKLINQGLSLAWQALNNQIGLSLQKIGGAISNFLKLEDAIKSATRALENFNRTNGIKSQAKEALKSGVISKDYYNKHKKAFKALEAVEQGYIKKSKDGIFELSNNYKKALVEAKQILKKEADLPNFSLPLTSKQNQSLQLAKQVDALNKEIQRIQSNTQVTSIEDSLLIKNLLPENTKEIVEKKVKETNDEINKILSGTSNGGGSILQTDPSSKKSSSKKSKISAEQREQQRQERERQAIAKREARERKAFEENLKRQTRITQGIQGQIGLNKQLAQIKQEASQSEFSAAQTLSGLKIEETQLRNQRQLIQEKINAKQINDQVAQGELQSIDRRLIEIDTARDLLSVERQRQEISQKIQAAQVEISNKLKNIEISGENVTLKSKEAYQQYEATVEALVNQLKILGLQKNEIQEIFKLNTDKFQQATSQISQSTQGLQNNIQQAASGMSNAISGAFQNGEFSLKKFGQAALQTFLNIGQSIVSSGLSQLLSGGFSGGGLGTTIGGLFSSIFGGFFADGGVAPANKLSVVGERGPELIMPSSARRVVPNHQLGAMGGSGGTVVHMHIKANDAKSFEDMLSNPGSRKLIGNFATAAVQRNSHRRGQRAPGE